MSNRKIDGNYIVERLNATNLADVEKLHTAVYNRLSQPGFFKKKYDTAFIGVEYVGHIAYNADRLPIAFCGVIPCFIQSGDRIILAAQSADTMTHPDYRNKGLFVELGLTTFQLCKESGIQLLFGFPNQNSLPGYVNKLNWQRTETMDCFIIHTDNFSWGRIAGKVSLLKKLYTRRQIRILDKYKINKGGLANSVIKDNYAGIYRDEAYFNYKTYNDTYVIRTGRSTLWIKASSILLIGDINVIADDFDDMIYSIKKLANRLGIKQIHFHASPDTTLHKLFAMRFNSIPSFPVIFKTFGDDTITNQVKFTSADIDTF